MSAALLPDTLLPEVLFPYTYTLYGLHIHSNEPMPLLPAPRQATPDLTIEFKPEMALPDKADTTLRHALPYVDRNGEPLWQLRHAVDPHGAMFWLRCWIGTAWGDSLLRADGKKVDVRLDANFGLEEVMPMVLGADIALALRLQGFTCLHASAVLIDGKVVAFTGVAETGKSTTMAALLQRGATFFSDDLVPLATQVGPTCTYPGYPRLGLWNDSMQALFGAQADLPHLGVTGKRVYTPSMLEDGARTWPLAAIYLLRPRSGDPALTQPRLVPLSQLEAVTELMPHTIGITLRTLQDHAHDLARVAQVARSIPVRAVERPDDLSRLDAVAEMIWADVGQIVG